MPDTDVHSYVVVLDCGHDFDSEEHWIVNQDLTDCDEGCPGNHVVVDCYEPA